MNYKHSLPTFNSPQPPCNFPKGGRTPSPWGGLGCGLQLLTSHFSLLTLLLSLFLLFAATVRAAEVDADSQPNLVMQLRVELGAPRNVGKVWIDDSLSVTAHRFIIPITGGTFAGPRISGKIMPGGADYQLSYPEAGRTDLDAIYEICTDDGIIIHVRNRGSIVTTTDDQGRRTTVFRTSPRFEVDCDSPYSWLAAGKYYCEPDASQMQGGIVLNIYSME